MFRHVVSFVALIASIHVAGCFTPSPSRGGGQVKGRSAPLTNPSDVLVPAGYRVEVVATGLTFPTGVAFDEQDRPHVVEAGYCYGETWTTPRLVRVESDGRLTQVAAGSAAPWNGVAYHDGNFYVTAGGHRAESGQILRISADGKTVEPVYTGFPSFGDHHTNGPVVGPDGWLY